MPTELEKQLAEKKRHVRRRIEFQEEAIHKHVWMCCFNCEHFADGTLTCNKFHAQPPAKVIVHGCRDWEDRIPF